MKCTMKRIYLAFTFVVLLLAGCAQEIETTVPKINITPGEKIVSVKASVKDTKVSSDNVGFFSWQVGDSITVVTDHDNIRQFFTADSGISADFSGQIPGEDEVGKYALYPASRGHFADDNELLFHIDNEIVWIDDASNMPMLGKISGGGASFKAVGGALKLICFNIPAEADYLLFSATNKQISGDFAIADASIASPVIATAAKSSGNNELLIDFSANYSASKVFYIPLPTGTIDGFTVSLLDDQYDELFSKTTEASLDVTANKLIIGPALNCASMPVIWREDFYGYAADDNWTGGNSAAIITTGTHAGHASGDSDITYTTTNGNSTTKLYDASDAGGSTPELLINQKKGETPGGTFVIAHIPTNGAASMKLVFKSNQSIKVEASSGITVGSVATGAGEKTVILTNTSDLDEFSLTFNNDYTKNCRIDDILLSEYTPYSSPLISTGVETLTVGVGQTTKTTTCSLSNAVDGLGISTMVTGDDTSWIESIAIADGNLTLTATGANISGADYTATLTLKATGAANKVVTLKQTNSLVPNPSVSVTPGNATFTATWTGDSHASSYVAYLRTTDSAPVDGSGDPTDGTTDITASISETDGVYSITDYAASNDQEYFLYVKVDGVSANYTAPGVFVKKTFTPTDATKGTAENPYTVAEAIAAYDLAGSPVDGVYVKGIVSTAGFLDGTYVSCKLSDDGSTTTEFELYKIDGGKTISDFAVGDAVIAHGQLKLYSSTYELSVTTVDALLKKPVFTPNGGNFVGSQSVSIASTGSESIRYSTDGSSPTTSTGSVYSSALDLSATTTVKAVGIDENELICTGVASATFTKVTGYALTWSAPSNGSITVKHGETTLSSGDEIAAGETITITVSPSVGYALSTLVYNDGSDHDIKDTKTFTMPSNAVSITATFETSAGPVDLEAPETISITDINLAEKKFSGSWDANSDASSYDWVISTASTAAAISAENTKASGSTTSTSFTTAALGDSYKPVAGTVYYLYVRSVGDGVSFTTSDYGQAHAIIYQHIFTAKPSTGDNITLSTISWTIAATELNGYNSANYAGVQFGTSKKDGSISLSSSNSWGAQTSTNYYGYGTVKKVNVWANLGGTSVTPSVSIGGTSATGSGSVVKNASAGSDWTKTSKVVFTPGLNALSQVVNTGVVVVNLSSVKAGYICAIEVLSE